MTCATLQDAAQRLAQTAMQRAQASTEAHAQVGNSWEIRSKNWENHGKLMGKTWENHGQSDINGGFHEKIMGNHGKI
jgi:hypothetical protein